MVEDFSVKKLN